MGNFFGFRRRSGNSRSVSSINGSFRINGDSSNSVVERRRAEVAARYPTTARSMSSEKEKGGASHASSAASTASKPNKYSFIPDNFSTIEQVTTSSSSSSSSALGFSALKLVVSFRRL